MLVFPLNQGYRSHTSKRNSRLNTASCSHCLEYILPTLRNKFGSMRRSRDLRQSKREDPFLIWRCKNITGVMFPPFEARRSSDSSLRAIYIPWLQDQTRLPPSYILNTLPTRSQHFQGRPSAITSSFIHSFLWVLYAFWAIFQSYHLQDSNPWVWDENRCQIFIRHQSTVRCQLTLRHHIGQDLCIKGLCSSVFKGV